MEPSSGRDRPTPSSATPSDNPFITFRRFADSQVSSLLQGIIGLPSAFAKRENGDRWTNIDEDLRRRDDQHSRQQQLKSAEGGKSANIQASISDQQLYDPSSHKTEPYRPYREGHIEDKDAPYPPSQEGSTQSDPDIPLYSPFNPSHFRQHWNHRGGYASESQSIAASEASTSPHLQSEYSLLSYLLFSKYSPIALSAAAAETGTPDTFMYCAAFEDLVRTTTGEIQVSVKLSHSIGGIVEDLVRPDRARYTMPSLASMLAASPHGGGAWYWISDLYFRGLLQERKSLALSDFQANKFGGTPPLTELEMFERLFRFGSESTGPLDSIRNLFNFATAIDEGRVENHLQDLVLEARRRMMESEASEARKRVDVEQRESNHTTYEKTTRNENSGGGNMIIATSTSTDRTTHEDGTVETCVTVWKQLADGKTSTTTTTHVEEPSYHQSENGVRGHETRENTIDDKNENKSEKKGWFWN